MKLLSFITLLYCWFCMRSIAQDKTIDSTKVENLDEVVVTGCES